MTLERSTMKGYKNRVAEVTRLRAENAHMTRHWGIAISRRHRASGRFCRWAP